MMHIHLESSNHDTCDRGAIHRARRLLIAALLLLTGLGLLAAPATADENAEDDAVVSGELSYTWVELRHSRRGYSDFLGLDIDGDSGSIRTDDADGWGVAGSVALGERFYLTGSYDEYDELGLSIASGGFDGLFIGAGTLEQDSGRLALGWRLPFGERFELNAEVGAEFADYRVTGALVFGGPDGGLDAAGTVEAAGVEPDARLGFRYRVRRFELGAGARYSSLLPGDLLFPSGEDGQLELEEDVVVDANVLFHFDFGLGLGFGLELGELETVRFLARWSF